MAVSTIDPIILNTFWKLAEGSNDERITATNLLVKQLTKTKVAEPEEGKVSSELQYVLQRLVRGLSSNRQWARLGYSVALTQVLRYFREVQVSDVISVIQNELKVSKHDSKGEAGNILLGRAFGFMALIQSGRLFECKGKVIGEVAKEFLSLQTEKSYLKQICAQGLTQIISKVKQSVFEKRVWPQIQEDLQKGWDDCSPERFLLLITCQEYHQVILNKKFMKQHWKTLILFGGKVNSEIHALLQRSSSEYPGVHMVLDVIVKGLVNSEQDVTVFWDGCIRQLLSATSRVSWKHLGLHLFIQVLPHIQTSNQMQEILHPEVVACLVANMGSKNNPLADISRKAADALCDKVHTSSDPDLQLTVHCCLVQPPGTVLFDSITNSTVVSRIINSFSKTAVGRLSDNLMAFIHGKDTFKFDKIGHEEKQKWALSCLNHLLTVSRSPDPALQLAILQYFFLRGFFTVQNKCASVPHCDQTISDLSEPVQLHSRSMFFKALNSLSTFMPEKTTKTAQMKLYVGAMYEVVQYAELLRNTGEVEQISPFSEKAEEEWQKCIEVINKTEKKRAKQQSVEQSDAFQMLFEYLGLQLFTESSDAIEVLQDLHVCYNKAVTRRRKSTISSEEPEWIEVITEVLLSLMSKASSLARTVAGTVFRMLLPHLSREALVIITNVLGDQKDEDEDQIDFEDVDDEDMEVDEDGNVNGKIVDEMEEKGEEEQEEDESEDDDEDDEDDEGMEEEEPEDPEEFNKFRASVKEALGKAADDSEEEEEEEDDDDMSDSEMMKLDDKLAAAFRAMKKGGKKEEKERKKQIVEFKSKVLDLLIILSHSSPSAGMVLDLMEPLLVLIDAGERQKEAKNLASKATEIFRTLYKQRKIAAEPDLPKKEFFDTVVNLIQYMRTVSSLSMAKLVSDACLLVVRLMLDANKSSGQPSPVRTRAMEAKQGEMEQEEDDYHEKIVEVIKTSLLDLLYRRDNRLHIYFFHNIAEKFPLFLWPLSNAILDTLEDSNVKIHSKNKACSLLAIIIRGDLSRKVEPEEWAAFAERAWPLVESMLLETSAQNLKPGFFHQLLQVVFYLLQACKPDNIKLNREAVEEKLQSLKKDLKADVRRLVNRTSHLLRNKTDVSESRSSEKNGFEPSQKKRKLNLSHSDNTKPADDKNKKSKVSVESEIQEESQNGLQNTTPSEKKRNKKKKKKGKSEGDNS